MMHDYDCYDVMKEAEYAIFLGSNECLYAFYANLMM